jgi:N-acetylglucosaminyldiphosphoundecaprenol N-acetyl-beta-D-mannosaminyltransferase
MYHSIDLLGIKFSAIRMNGVLDIANQHIADRKPLLLGIVNVAKIVNMRKDRELRDSLSQANLILADGAPLVWLSRTLGNPLPERVAGIDIMFELLREANNRQYRIYLLGAKPKVLWEAVAAIERKYSGAQIAGYQDGYFSQDQEPDIVERIKQSRADILFVGMSSPKKEIFLNRWYQHIDVPVCHGVGGSFDILAGVTERAPLWMQNRGLEWLYRLLQEPGRLWKRYLITNTTFIVLSLQAIIKSQLCKLLHKCQSRPAINFKKQTE